MVPQRCDWNDRVFNPILFAMSVVAKPGVYGRTSSSLVGRLKAKIAGIYRALAAKPQLRAGEQDDLAAW